MRWTIHGERSLYDSEWMSLHLADVELPDGHRFDHHVVRLPRGAAGAVVHDDRERLLLLYRHRFITDTWGWEVPSGGVDAGEEPADAAAREVLEETGWRPGRMRALCSYNASNGFCDQRLHLFSADGAAHVGPPSDPFEAERVEWVPLAEVPALIRDGQVPDGLTMVALLHMLAFGGSELRRRSG